MHENLRNLLPETMSDEAAYHLCEFVSQLAYVLDSIYFDKARRYLRDITTSHNPQAINEERQDPPF